MHFSVVLKPNSCRIIVCTVVAYLYFLDLLLVPLFSRIAIVYDILTVSACAIKSFVTGFTLPLCRHGIMAEDHGAPEA